MPGRPPAGAESEKEWQATLVAALETFGWAVNHTRPGQSKNGKWSTPTTAAGWPDLVALRREWIIAIEVKGWATRVGPGQLEWLARFASLGHGCGWLLRPDAPMDDIAGWVAHPETAPYRYGW